MSDALMVHDFELMDWIGANSFRTSHYPYAEEVLEYSDRRGVVVIAETAAVGLNLKFSAAFGRPASATHGEEAIGSGTQRTHLQALRELIARDRNHPSVVLWSIANEPESGEPAARDYFGPLFAEARKLDPTRPVGFVGVMFEPADRCKITELADVVLLNRYYGWYTRRVGQGRARGGLLLSRAALDHYRRMVGTCLDRGVTLVVTYDHFTTPRWFAAGGGWRGAAAADRFARYAAQVTEHLGDLVP
jgi:hypothetical protein